MREILFKINEEDDGKEIKEILKNFGVSSALLTKLKNSENGITVNGEFRRSIDRVKAGDELKISIENRGKAPEGKEMHIEIIYEDEDIIVLNKPPFLPVHESRNHIGDTLSNFVSYHLKDGGAFRAVFRLDRDTSGLVLCAKHELAAAKLAGKIKKDYYAVVEGEINEGGTVDLPIERCGNSIIKRKVSTSGEKAVTHFEVIRVKDGCTLLKINLETGRTHQIRVHFSHLNHPLLGDTLYGKESDKIKRQALHCKDIYFIHPVTNEKMHLMCDFPSDFKGVI